MKNTLLVISFVATGISCFATKDAVKETPAKKSFAHHSAEVYLTPGADYFLHKKGSNEGNTSPYEFHMPFIGFDIGAQYMYRLCELFGISSGLGFMAEGEYYRHTNYFLGKKYVDQRIAGHTGYLNIPLEFHLFKEMPHSTFQFATGPQFNFPLFHNEVITGYNTDGSKIITEKTKTKFTGKEISDGAALGWNIVMGAELDLCEYSNVFIGPQIGFSNIAYFKKSLNELGKTDGREYPISLGLKVAFSLHGKE